MVVQVLPHTSFIRILLDPDPAKKFWILASVSTILAAGVFEPAPATHKSQMATLEAQLAQQKTGKTQLAASVSELEVASNFQQGPASKSHEVASKTQQMPLQPEFSFPMPSDAPYRNGDT